MLDDSFSSHRAVWVEITENSHDHGGEGWEFGTCLWSPTCDKAGGHAYQIMTLPEAGDLVLHFYKYGWDNRRPFRRLCAQSLVELPAREVHEEPPSPGPWEGMSPFYRIELTAFQWLEEPLDLGEFSGIYADEVLHEKNTDEPKYYPFQRYGNDTHVATGTYLARCTENLYGLLQKAMEIEASADDPEERESGHKEFTESRRKMRETSYLRAQLPARQGREGALRLRVPGMRLRLRGRLRGARQRLHRVPPPGTAVRAEGLGAGRLRHHKPGRRHSPLLKLPPDDPPGSGPLCQWRSFGSGCRWVSKQ